jgi:hypothetical protein
MKTQKQNPKKLDLAKSTIRTLSNAELGQIAGGATSCVHCTSLQ